MYRECLLATLFYAVAFPLQTLAACNAASMLDTLGVPVLLDGNVIHLTKQSRGVADAWGGIPDLALLGGGGLGRSDAPRILALAAGCRCNNLQAL